MYIFGKFEAFHRRLVKIIDVFNTIRTYSVLQESKIEGLEGMITKYQVHIRFYIMGQSNLNLYEKIMKIREVFIERKINSWIVLKLLDNSNVNMWLLGKWADKGKEKVPVDMWKKCAKIKADWKKATKWGDFVTGVMGAWCCTMITIKNEMCYISISTNVGLAVSVPLFISFTMQFSFIFFFFERSVTWVTRRSFKNINMLSRALFLPSFSDSCLFYQVESFLLLLNPS